jgi:hypothetical protein
MKYFTPEMFIHLQECESAAGFRAVNAKWEHAAQQYAAQLQEITPRLKGGLRRFVRQGSLHDARVLDIGATERRATLVVQEEAVSRLLSLTYALVDAPVIDRNALPDEHRTPETLWLYDEIDVDAEMLFNPKLRIQGKATALSVSVGVGEEWKPIFLHSILLSNGWEIRLRFHRLADMRTTSLLRTNAPGHQGANSVATAQP